MAFGVGTVELLLMILQLRMLNILFLSQKVVLTLLKILLYLVVFVTVRSLLFL